MRFPFTRARRSTSQEARCHRKVHPREAWCSSHPRAATFAGREDGRAGGRAGGRRVRKHRGEQVALFFVLSWVVSVPLAAQAPPPIIDMHLHAKLANEEGPTICAPFGQIRAWDQREPFPASFMRAYCERPLRSPESDEGVFEGTLEAMERLNMYGVLSGPAERVRAWRDAAPGRFIPGLSFQSVPGAPSPDSLRALVGSGNLAVLSEVANQYAGIGPDHESMAPYWNVAEQLSLPVGLHMGPGPPGVIYLGAARYRASLGNPLLLEDVLARHPGLRLYVMHAGFPFLDEMLAVLYAHPQVYVEVGVIVFTQPRPVFYRYLEALVEAGFEDRVMFGSDHMNWPDALEIAVQVIQEAPFLSQEQKRAILYDNAARFLRLSAEEQARHRRNELPDQEDPARESWR